MTRESEKVFKGKQASSVLTDQRFASLFTNPDFEVDQDSEQYKLINPAIKKIEEKRRRLIRKQRGNSIEGSDEDDEEVFEVLLHIKKVCGGR